MRKVQQQMILALLKTMQDSNKEIKKYFLQKNFSIVRNLLAGQQDGTAQVIDFIEEVSGEGTQTVTLLEGYYKTLYELSEQIDELKVTFVNRLQTALNEIERNVKKEQKPDKLEILFLSYKASMCDSLESIWLAAKDDPQCDAYFVAIPYYDRLPGGSLGEMHDEGSLHPDYIPIIDWRSYDIAQRHPDVIFIYNPYDDSNLVTSVHPDFYSRRLKTLTDMLCYVPYFVATSGVADHSITCAGPLYADRVFLESDSICHTFMQVFQRFEKDNHIEGRFGNAREKFLALGHPKYDKVINAKRADYTIPDAWRKLIERPDGTWRKIVLYNTNILGLLSGEEHFLLKLTHVLRIFKDRDDAVLWWRPHPLNEATYQSMRPHLADMYMKIVEQFKREGYGIYDDTPDLHRAICFSSMYYGDSSSLVALYQCTGNPVMCQDMGLHGTDSPGQHIVPFALYDAGNHLWFTTNAGNALFLMDKNTRSVKYMGTFPMEKAHWKIMHAPVAQIGNILYFTPLFAEAINTYNLNTGQFYNIPIPQPKSAKYVYPYYDYAKFSNVFAHKSALYFIPATYPGILVYHTDNGLVEILDGWVEYMYKLLTKPAMCYAFGCAFDDRRDRILLACRCTNALLEINPNTRSVQIRTVGDASAKYIDIYYDEGICWLLLDNKPALMRWNPAKNQYKTFDISLGVTPRNDLPQFSRIVRKGDHLLLVPVCAEKMVAFDLTNETMRVVDSFTPERHGSNNYVALLAVVGNIIYLRSFPNNHLIEYDTVTGALRESGLRVSDPKDIEALRENGIFMQDCRLAQPEEGIFFEHPFMTISDLLDIMAQPVQAARMDVPARTKVLREKTIVHADGKAGQAIYTFCKNQILNL